MNAHNKSELKTHLKQFTKLELIGSKVSCSLVKDPKQMPEGWAWEDDDDPPEDANDEED